MAKKHWIQQMHMKKGALHRMMHIPAGQKIPEGKLEAAAHGDGLKAKRARLAMTLKRMHHGKK